MMGGIYRFTGTDMGIGAAALTQAGSLVLPPVDAPEMIVPILSSTRK
jgi:hypothetical protein